MIIPCTGCSCSVSIDDRYMYDLEIYGERLRCRVCRSPLDLKGLPRLFQGNDEQGLLFGKDLNEEVVKNLKRLYPMPHVTYKARRLINSDRVGFREISNLLKTDPALAARILKVANSAYYGMKGEISSVHHASTMLGGKTLLQIITLVSQAKALGKSLSGYDILSGDMWKHSIRTAVCSNILCAKSGGSDDEDDSFFAGLIHDSGKIILDNYIQERKKIFQRYIITSKTGYLHAEQRILGFDHAYTGYELCRKWNLPPKVADAVRFHHNPFASEGNSLAYIVYIADHMARMPDEENDYSWQHGRLDQALAFLGFKPENLEGLLNEAFNAVEALEEDSY